MDLLCGDQLKRVTVVLPPSVHQKLKLLSIVNDQTMNTLVLTAVKEYISKYPEVNLKET